MISLILAKKILSLFLVMALGIVLVRCGIVRSRDSKVLSMISLYLVMPCVIISSFQVKYQPEILNGLLLALATAVLLHLVLIVVVGFLGKVLKLDGVEETSLIYSNAGNLIIPIVTAILGKEWVIYTSAFLSVQLFLLWSHAKMKLCGEKGIDLKKILTNINMIAIFAGVLLFLLKVLGILLLVVLALVPAIVAATVVFGPRALFLVVFCAVISMFTEMVCQKLMQKETTYTDGSAMLTGVLLALNLPATLPLWEAAIGCVFAIAVVKQLFGGLGCNFANPAITGRVFLLLSFGGDMTTWVKPFFYRGRSFFEMFAATGNLPDGVTGATPLASGDAGLLDLFLGNVGGSLGETSALALLIGGVFLLVLGLISWHTPVAYLGGLAVLELFYTLATGGEMTDVLYALLSGGVILGAFFMATDYVTTPMTGAGKLIFGLGCAVLTFVIREFANMPEGCSFSILLMNLLTPYIDKLTMTHPFGAKPAVKKEAK